MTGPGRAAVVEGLGAWLPPTVVTNEELSRRLDTSDEWIRTRTGIRSRHVVSGDISTGTMAVQAAQRALKCAGGGSVDALVLATTTPDRPCPATAPAVASALGLGTIPAFDVSAVCSGFLYALAAGAGLIAAGTAQRALVVASEAFTTLLDPDDRATVSVFGDGAGAVVLRAGEHDELGALGPIVLGADGSEADLITVRAGGAEERAAGASGADPYFRMRGGEVFTRAVTRMTQASRDALAAAGWQIADLDAFVGHQANIRILNAVAQQLDLDPAKLVVHLDEVGNTAGASIPLALTWAHGLGLLRPADRVALAAFGGGLTWGAATLRWPELGPAQL